MLLFCSYCFKHFLQLIIRQVQRSCAIGFSGSTVGLSAATWVSIAEKLLVVVMTPQENISDPSAGDLSSK